MPRLVSLLDLELASGTLRISNLEDGAIPQYIAKLSAPIRLARALPDPFFRLQGARQAEVRMSNIAVAGDTEATTVSQILAAEELLGRPARARLRDLDTGEDLFDLSGVVAHVVNLTQTDAAFSIEADDPAAWQESLPKIATLDWFPSAVASAQEHSVIVLFGEMRKAELALLHAGYFEVAFAMVATGGNNYRHDDISNVADYVAAGGDVLVYDILWLQSDARIALDLEASDGTALRDLAAKDQNDHDASPATALPDELVLNRWYRRRIELPAGLDGKTITRFMVACEQDASGSFTGFIANAYVITAGGAIARTIHNEFAPAPVLANVRTGNAANTLTGTQRAVYDYGPIRTPATGALTIATVYRAGRIVAPAEYSVVTPIPGLTVLRFTRAQRDGQGTPMAIQADLVSTEFHQVDPGPIDRGPSPAKVIKFLLEDATYGLGKATAAVSFTQAASDYGAALYKVSGGLDVRTPAVDVLRQLLLRGAVLERDSTGAFTLEVDKASRHAAAAIALGQGDDRGWQNCEVIGDAVPRIEERTKTLVLRGLPDPGFGTSQPTFLLSTSRTRAENGVSKQIDQFFVGDINVLDRECDYLWKRLKALDRALRVRADAEARELALGDLTDVFVPNLLYAGETMEVRGIGFDGAPSFELALVRWDAALFTYAKGSTARVDPRAQSLTDYSRTYPEAPANFSNQAPATTINSNGIGEAKVRVQADAPAQNVTHLVFQAVRVGLAAIRTEVAVQVTAGQAAVVADLMVEPGQIYDLKCFARNTLNEPGFQDGFVSTIANVVVSADSNAPTNAPLPAGISIATNPDGSMDVTLTWSPYIQGAIPAHNLVLFWKLGNAPLASPAAGDVAVFLSPGATSYTLLGLNPAANYRFGIAAARKPFGVAGYVIGAIQAPTAGPDWADVGGSDPLYSGDLPACSFSDAFDSDSSENYQVAAWGGLAKWTWNTASSRLEGGDGLNAFLLRKGFLAKDGWIECDTTQMQDGGLVFRFVDSRNHYLLALRDDSGAFPTANFQLYKCVRGTYTAIGSFDHIQSRGTQYTIRLEIIGTTINCYMGAFVHLTVNDSAIQKVGWAGLRSQSATNYHQRLAAQGQPYSAADLPQHLAGSGDPMNAIVWQQILHLGSILNNVVATLGSNRTVAEDVWTDILSVTVSVPAIMYDVAVLLFANMSAAVTVTTGGSVEVYWRILRDATVLRTSGKSVTTQATDVDIGALFHVDTAPPAGASVVYKLQAMKNQVSGSHTVTVKPPAALNAQAWIN